MAIPRPPGTLPEIATPACALVRNDIFSFILGGSTMISTECESCWHYDYDEEFEEYYCMMDLDEDEVYRIMSSRNQHCPFYRQGDDYTLARRQ